MKNSGWIIILFCNLTLTQAQDLFTEFDTIRLEEFTITQRIPLNDQSVLDLSRSSRFSSIDKINGRLEGISLIKRGAYALEPQMDGFSGGQINVTVDGMRMFGACTDRMDPVTSYIEPDNLESFNITHGTSGSRNGNTVGGSFDMILREPVIGQTEGMLVETGLGYESVSNGINANGALEVNREKWAFRTSGTYRNHNSYRGGDGIKVPYSYFKKINLHSVVKYDLGKNNTLRFDFLLDDAVDVGYPALPMDVGKAKARMYAVEIERLDAYRTVSQLKAKLYFNSVYHLMDDSNRDSTFRLTDENGAPSDTVYMRMDMPGWSDTFGFFMEGGASLGEKSHIYVKLDDYLNYSRAYMTMFMNYPEYPGEPPMYTETWPDVFRNVAGIFIRNTTRVSNSVNVNLEGRLDMSQTRVTSETGHRQFAIFGYDIDRGYFELPKSLNLSANFRTNGVTRLDAGAGYAERLPTTSEQFGFFLYNALDGFDYLGNPEIGLERSTHFWGNLHFTWPELKVSIRNRFSYVSDYIIGLIDPEIPQMNLYASGVKRYDNIPAALLYGTSLQLQWDPGAYLTFYTLLRYTYGRTGEGDPLPLIPPLRNTSICKFRKGIFSVQMEGEFSSDQNRINSGFGENPTPAFAIYHLRNSFHWLVKETVIEVGAGIENIFDKAYSEHLDWGNFLRPGRSIYLNLRVII
ncbi:MAG: TonB-dependent receptor plug domain-containing protein [Bacteroidales bacterium]|nr:TonB-dependent receptor plug domain-containing protein [Bacteroidales bacterium]